MRESTLWTMVSLMNHFSFITRVSFNLGRTYTQTISNIHCRNQTLLAKEGKDTLRAQTPNQQILSIEFTIYLLLRRFHFPTGHFGALWQNLPLAACVFSHTANRANQTSTHPETDTLHCNLNGDTRWLGSPLGLFERVLGVKGNCFVSTSSATEQYIVYVYCINTK